jgi:hypothetical protein
LVIATPDIYSDAVRQALRAELAGSAKFLIDRGLFTRAARVVTVEHLSALLDEVTEARALLHNFMIEKMPAIVHVHSREALAKARDHPEVAERLRNANAGAKRRDRARRAQANSGSQE